MPTASASPAPVWVVAAATAAGAAGAALARCLEQRLSWRVACRAHRRAAAAAEARCEDLHLMRAGEAYNANDALLMRMRDAAHAVSDVYNDPARTGAERTAILRGLLGSCPSEGQPYIEPNFRVDYGVNIHVGRNFYANFNCVMLDCARITLGDNVFLAPNVQLYTAAHPLDYLERRVTEFAKPIRIGDDVWIGGGAIVLPGVTIGSRVVVAAGAVVSRDVGDDVVVAGVPARIIKQLK